MNVSKLPSINPKGRIQITYPRLSVRYAHQIYIFFLPRSRSPNCIFGLGLMPIHAPRKQETYWTYLDIDDLLSTITLDKVKQKCSMGPHNECRWMCCWIRLHLTYMTYGPGDDDVVLALRQPKLRTMFLRAFRFQIRRDAWIIDILRSSQSSRILSIQYPLLFWSFSWPMSMCVAME